MMLKSNDRTRLNFKFFEHNATVRNYEAYMSLQQGELAIISRLKGDFSGRRILDMGVGAGRTTPALLDISKRYIGIDISLPMISTCCRRFPSASFEVCDARDLSRFDDRSFDLVFFSHNGIDYISHVDRLTALGEIHRVLINGGEFAFSSHNRQSLRAGRTTGSESSAWTRWDSAQLLWQINPFKHPRRFSRNLLRLTGETVAYLYNRQYEEYNNEYVIVKDVGRLFSYCIDIETQIRQLQEIGFERIEAVDLDGNWLVDENYTKCKDTWIYYLCHKP